MMRLQGFLSRNAYPYQVLDPAKDRDTAELIKRICPECLGPAAGGLSERIDPQESRRG
jgi:hypothetical protein